MAEDKGSKHIQAIDREVDMLAMKPDGFNSSKRSNIVKNTNTVTIKCEQGSIDMINESCDISDRNEMKFNNYKQQQRRYDNSRSTRKCIITKVNNNIDLRDSSRVEQVNESSQKDEIEVQEVVNMEKNLIKDHSSINDDNSEDEVNMGKMNRRNQVVKCNIDNQAVAKIFNNTVVEVLGLMNNESGVCETLLSDNRDYINCVSNGQRDDRSKDVNTIKLAVDDEIKRVMIESEHDRIDMIEQCYNMNEYNTEDLKLKNELRYGIDQGSINIIQDNKEIINKNDKVEAEAMKSYISEMLPKGKANQIGYVTNQEGDKSNEDYQTLSTQVLLESDIHANKNELINDINHVYNTKLNSNVKHEKATGVNINDIQYSYNIYNNKLTKAGQHNLINNLYDRTTSLNDSSTSILYLEEKHIYKRTEDKGGTYMTSTSHTQC